MRLWHALTIGAFLFLAVQLYASSSEDTFTSCDKWGAMLASTVGLDSAEAEPRIQQIRVAAASEGCQLD